MSDAPMLHLARPWMVVLDVVVWGVWSVAAGVLAHRLPARRLDHDAAWSRLRSFERGGRVYERLGIKRWKDKLPEAGAWFTGGFSKRHVTSRDRRFLERFATETRRAELTHWLVMVAAPVFFVWNFWWVGLVMIAYALAANLPCVLVQRYNRGRLARVLARFGPADGGAARDAVQGVARDQSATARTATSRPEAAGKP